MNDDRTPRGYALPHLHNYQDEDIPRLREAFGKVDEEMTATQGRIGALENQLAAMAAQQEKEQFEEHIGLWE